jgi:hypothetical protein
VMDMVLGRNQEPSERCAFGVVGFRNTFLAKSNKSVE